MRITTAAILIAALQWPTSPLATTTEDRVTAQVLGRMTLAALHVLALKAKRNGTATQANVDCLSQQDLEPLLPAMQVVLEQQMSSEERRINGSFLASSAGEKVWQLGLWQFYEDSGEDPPVSRPDFSQAELEQLERWGDTDASKKLLLPLDAFRNAWRDEMPAAVADIVRNCRARR